MHDGRALWITSKTPYDRFGSFATEAAKAACPCASAVPPTPDANSTPWPPSQGAKTRRNWLLGYPARMLAFIPIPGHLGNVGQDHDGGNNVQRASLAERISADGFGCCDLLRLRSRILLPGLLEQRVRDRCRDAERRYDAT